MAEEHRRLAEEVAQGASLDDPGFLLREIVGTHALVVAEPLSAATGCAGRRKRRTLYLAFIYLLVPRSSSPRQRFPDKD